MPFPKLRHCLICDNAREEARGKVALLGFLGVAPDVDVLLVDAPPGQAMAVHLSFVFVGGPGEGSHHVTYELFDVDERKSLGVIDPGNPTEINPVPGATITNFIINVLMPVTHFGRYELRVLVGGKLNFSGAFKLSPLPKSFPTN